MVPRPAGSCCRATIPAVIMKEDLTGTWTLTGATVILSPRGPSVLRFAQFTPAPDQLSGERVLSGETLRLVLIRNH